MASRAAGRRSVNERRESNAVDTADCKDMGDDDACRSTDSGAGCFSVCSNRATLAFDSRSALLWMHGGHSDPEPP